MRARQRHLRAAVEMAVIERLQAEILELSQDLHAPFINLIAFYGFSKVFDRIFEAIKMAVLQSMDPALTSQIAQYIYEENALASSLLEAELPLTFLSPSIEKEMKKTLEKCRGHRIKPKPCLNLFDLEKKYSDILEKQKQITEKILENNKQIQENYKQQAYILLENYLAKYFPLSASIFLEKNLEFLEKAYFSIGPYARLALILGYGYSLAIAVKKITFSRYPLGILHLKATYRDRYHHLLEKSNQVILLTPSAVSQKKANLEILRDDLQNKTASLRYLSRVIVVITAVYLYFKPENIPSLAGLFLAVIGSAVFHTVSDYNRYTERKKQEAIRRSNLKALNELSKLLDQATWEIQDDPNNKASYFFILPKIKGIPNFEINDKKYPVSRKQMIRAMRAVFIKYELDVVSGNNNEIFIASKTELNQKDRLAPDILFYLEKIVNIEIKKPIINAQLTQCTDSLSVISSWHMENTLGANQFPNITHKIVLNQNDCEKTASLLLRHFGAERILVTQISAQQFVVTIVGVEPCSNPELLPIPKTPMFSCSTQTEQPTRINHSEREKKEEEPPAPQSEQNETQQVIVDFGPSYGVFNSRREGKIKELKSPFFPRYTHFGLFPLPREAFSTPALYDRFESIHNTATIVPPTGHQGIVQTVKTVRNPNRQWVQSHFKLKSKGAGELGLFRVHDGNTVSCTGKGNAVLHVFNTVVKEH